MWQTRRYWAALLVVLTIVKFGFYAFSVVVLSLSNGVVAIDIPQHARMLKTVDGYQTNLTTIVIFVFVALVVWLIVDISSGQFKRDWVAFRVGRYLQQPALPMPKAEQQSIATIDLAVNDQRRANHYLRRSKLRLINGRLVLTIPCGPTASTRKIIMERCQSAGVTAWLHERYPTVNWKKPAVHSSAMRSKIIIEQK